MSSRELVIKLHNGLEADDNINEILEQIEKDKRIYKEKINDINELSKVKEYKEINVDGHLNRNEFIKEFYTIEIHEKNNYEDIVSELNHEKNFIHKKKSKIRRILRLMKEKKNEALEYHNATKSFESFKNLTNDFEVNYLKYIKNLEMDFESIKYSIES